MPASNETLWLFGDTLAGTFEDGRRQQVGCWMPHQTFGTQAAPADPISFVWSTSETDGRPINFFRTNESVHEEALACEDRFNPLADAKPFYWVVAGIASDVAIGGAAPWGSLLLMAERIQVDPQFPLGFQVLGTTAIAIQDATPAPGEWNYTSRDLTTCVPWSSETCETWSTAVAAAPADGGGSGLCADGGCVYLLGGMGSPGSGAGQALLRGRLDALLLLEFTAIELLMSDGTWSPFQPGEGARFRSRANAGWARSHWLSGGRAPQPAVPRSLFPQQQAEGSLHFATKYGRWLFGAFNEFVGQTLLLWSSATADVASEWSSCAVYTLPPPFSDASQYFAYAVKLHPHLARTDDELVITYVANAWNVSMLFKPGNATIYTPQVLRLNLTAALASCG